ncbi:2-(3-amino-3-carboxypropyl)histidine synthase [ANME-1 cluster archaeon GoMg1]|nr:2-(3-amino-3-carboxypropyl)histidine synthase [ANME-1 cluster archaeon GoMg1]
MENNSYDFELGKIKELIKERGAKRVGLQLPEGIKTVATDIAAEISKETGAEVIISGNSCYGACDIDEKLMRNVDMLFHFGHTETFLQAKKFVVREKVPKKVVFIELRSGVDIKPAVEKAVAEIKGDTVGLVATVQHVHALKEAEILLARLGKKAIIGKSRLKYDGQVLGCEFSSAVVPCDEILFVGSGGFHPAGLALYTGKRVIAADPFTMQIGVYKADELRKKRYIAIERALDAKSVGIIIGMKSGQFNLSGAIDLKREAVGKGLDAYLITMDEISEDKLLGFKVDAFVNTACPRLVEDFTHFKKPVISIKEFEVVLGERRWEDCFVL